MLPLTFAASYVRLSRVIKEDLELKEKIQRWFGDLERTTRDVTTDTYDDDISANLNGIELSLGQERGVESGIF